VTAIVRLAYARELTEPEWRLHVRPGDGAHVALVGWKTRRPRIDEGVPAEVGRLVARAICREAQLTFLDSSSCDAGVAWEPVDEGWRRVVPAPLRLGSGGARAFPLTCTADARVATRLFADDDFQWVLRAQLGLLGRLGAPPPAVDHAALRLVLQAHNASLTSWAEAWSIPGLVLPGVDGDFVELVAFDDGFATRLSDALVAECSAARVPWHVVAESSL
jgi:hypothetical protein